MEKREIIMMHLKGVSFRSIAQQTGVNRKTVTRICKAYDLNQKKLESEDLSFDIKDDIIRNLVTVKKYNSQNRRPRKMIPEIQKRLNEIAQSEVEKQKLLGNNHKQKLDGRRVHEMLIEEGYDIAYRTMMNYWKEIQEKTSEAYIRQDYAYGIRVEYDFGEVKLYINKCVEKYYLAVFTAPASGFRWAYLYKNQKMAVFLDSHIKLFDMLGGVYSEVVYDNMRNVVSKFVGHEKEYNKQLVQMSLYYGFDIVTTNPRSGNEKGSVERSVEVIRKRCFTKKYQFESFEAAQKHLEDNLVMMRETSDITTEQTYLRNAKLPYELADLVTAKVNKYSCITLDNNHYSVPEYLVNKQLKVKKYHDHYQIYANNHYVCTHQKIDGVGQYQLDLKHYLKTLRQKPGALKHSLALKQCPQLQAIYQTYFKQKEREFIEILLQNKDKQLNELTNILIEATTLRKTVRNANEVSEATKNQLTRLNQLFGFHKEGENEPCPLKN